MHASLKIRMETNFIQLITKKALEIDRSLVNEILRVKDFENMRKYALTGWNVDNIIFVKSL